MKVKELSSRTEFFRAEREKALKLLQNEQQQGAVLKKNIEALQSQVSAPPSHSQDIKYLSCVA
jgi:uncharacterized protein YlxW (UPF0749 family)